VTDIVPAQTWKAGIGRAFVAEETKPDDQFVNVWIADPTDGPTARLTATQARQIAANLLRRANLLQGVPDLSAIPTAPVTRPNGKAYKPRRITYDRWDNEEAYGGDGCGAIILGTHDIEAARPIADQIVREWDNEYVATKPEVGWFRLSYAGYRGDMVWARDEVRGRAGVMFTADYPAATP
jgi:hypothetical protein